MKKAYIVTDKSYPPSMIRKGNVFTTKKDATSLMKEYNKNIFGRYKVYKITIEEVK